MYNRYRSRFEREFNDIERINNKVNHCFDIKQACIEIERRIEDYPIIQVVIKTYQKYNNNQLKRSLCFWLNDDIANKIMNEYLYSYISFVVDIHYGPYDYPFVSPIWQLCSVNIEGIDFRIKDGIEYLVNSHNDIISFDWSMAITFRTDLVYFMSKFCRFLEHI
jgi:hypothetical protein